jgi:uncharacterized PurR-regulated membrane protein YhhQ (DUF165 family)
MSKEARKYNNRMMSIASGMFAVLLFGCLIWIGITADNSPGVEGLELLAAAFFLLPVIFLASIASLIYYLRNASISSDSEKSNLKKR